MEHSKLHIRMNSFLYTMITCSNWKLNCILTSSKVLLRNYKHVDILVKQTRGSSNTPAFVFLKDGLGKAKMRYLKEFPSVAKTLTNFWLRPSFI